MLRSLAIVILLLATGECIASAPILQPLAAQVAYAEAIGVGEVISAKSLPQHPGPTVWRPNTEVAVRMTKTLRGKIPDRVTALVSVWREPQWKAGEKVFLFISKVKGKHVEVFAAAQGFHRLSAVQSPTKNAAANSLIDKSLVKLIAGENSRKDGLEPYYPTFSDKGTKILTDLSRHRNAHVRKWTVRNLCDLRMNASIGTALIAVLADADAKIAEKAAYALVFQKHKPAAAAIAAYAKTLTNRSLLGDVRKYLREVGSEK